MKTFFAIAATGTLMLSVIDASAVEFRITPHHISVATAKLPSWELKGFPISLHQLAVVGPTNIKEQSPSTSLTMAGMPASPHQVSVLTPRPRIAEERAKAQFECLLIPVSAVPER